MAKRLLAMVGARGSCEGPWQFSRGEETAARVTGLGEGDKVYLELDGDHKVTFQLSSGLNPLAKELQSGRYRLVKVAGLKPMPTTVEILL